MEIEKLKSVYIISSMRSGSTLLKALLATREDVSDLPEIHFSQSDSVKRENQITVFKAPGYFNEWEHYPFIPSKSAKLLVLIRNPYDTITSLRKMNLEVGIKSDSPLNTNSFLLSYWYYLNLNIINKLKELTNEIFIIKYEELITSPISITQKIFEFIGCKDIQGIDSYNCPESYTWKWGSDDGGDVIKTLKVQSIERKRNEKELLNAILCSSKKIKKLMRRFGYSQLELDNYLPTQSSS